jgi:two-component system, LytTR family, sensor kinase
VEREIALRSERALTLEQRKLRKAAEERARLERYLREMELRLLQAQLNPHFLFNALNLVLGESIAENASRTSDLVESLSTLLRNSIARIGSTVSLADEINSARAYVDIFAARFDKRIDMQTELASDISGFAVPALTLQPLVENALVHGIPGCDGQFLLGVRARALGDAIEIVVADNGPGLSPEELDSVRRTLQSRGPECKLTGLVGVNRRLKYYYEGIEDLQLDASDGFSVKIRIPR